MDLFCLFVCLGLFIQERYMVLYITTSLTVCFVCEIINELCFFLFISHLSGEEKCILHKFNLPFYLQIS